MTSEYVTFGREPAKLVRCRRDASHIAIRCSACHVGWCVTENPPMDGESGCPWCGSNVNVPDPYAKHADGTLKHPNAMEPLAILAPWSPDETPDDSCSARESRNNHLA